MEFINVDTGEKVNISDEEWNDKIMRGIKNRESSEAGKKSKHREGDKNERDKRETETVL